ncbi:MAG: tRNA pseudouridine(38-40) synthase TruA [Epsilonproteobacteria bacterium]|nr:tRNA pseudouridine(38-40) synthase TruA [Campylobacterota bacterium]
MRVALVLSYNGTHFFGSQEQTQTSQTVNGTLAHVLKQLGIDTKPIASGRTDKGVHATYQIVHIDLPEYWSDTQKLQRVLNEMLPPSLHVRKVLHVTKQFHARYSTTSRVYRYIIKQGGLNPFANDFITFLDAVDTQRIQQNIKLFEGEHDFANFMKTGSETTSTLRTVYKAFAYEYKGYVILHFEANGFLRSQIRFMVAALLELDANAIKQMLGCEKKHKIKPAPPNGLYLAKVKYPKEYYV